jgi:hypothetical protein
MLGCDRYLVVTDTPAVVGMARAHLGQEAVLDPGLDPRERDNPIAAAVRRKEASDFFLLGQCDGVVLSKVTKPSRARTDGRLFSLSRHCSRLRRPRPYVVDSWENA